MELVPIFALFLIFGCLAADSFEVQGNSLIDLPHESTLSKLLTGYSNNVWGENERVKRSMKEDIEKGFKEFSEKVAKLPDQLNGKLKKYFEERGVSLESIQKILNEIWAAVEKLIEEVKKAV